MADLNTRDLVLNILMEVLENKQHSHKVINATIDKYAYLDKQERSFIKKLSEGTIENLIQLDYIINKFSNIKVKKMKPEIRNILRLSVYQIIYMDSIPDYSVCDEAVKLTIATRKYKQFKGFVNGVLRSICREAATIEYPTAAIRYSLPDWIYEQWCQQYGKELALAMCQNINRIPTLTIRPGKGMNLDKLKEKLTNSGYLVKKAAYANDALELSGFDSLSSVAGFKEGEFYIQDISSMLVGQIADPKENSFCIDICAAPGGKSLHIAQLMNNTGQIIARDLTQNKVDLLNDNIRRSGFDNIKAEQFDATILDETLIGKADLVICDLPCSGLGVMSRKADIRYNISPDMQEELVLLQQKIALNAVKYLKLGGIMIYSTCTTNTMENIHNVNWLISNTNLRMESINNYLPEDLRSEATEQGYIQLLPGIKNTDGFFICKLRKVEE